MPAHAAASGSVFMYSTLARSSANQHCVSARSTDSQLHGQGQLQISCCWSSRSTVVHTLAVPWSGLQANQLKSNRPLTCPRRHGPKPRTLLKVVSRSDSLNARRNESVRLAPYKSTLFEPEAFRDPRAKPYRRGAHFGFANRVRCPSDPLRYEDADEAQ